MLFFTPLKNRRPFSSELPSDIHMIGTSNSFLSEQVSSVDEPNIWVSGISIPTVTIVDYL